MFGDVIATWQILVGKRKRMRGLLDEVSVWFTERLEGSPLLDPLVSDAIGELGRPRNQAAHPGKAPIDEDTARKCYTMCVEAPSPNHDFGLIPGMAKIDIASAIPEAGDQKSNRVN